MSGVRAATPWVLVALACVLVACTTGEPDGASSSSPDDTATSEDGGRPETVPDVDEDRHGRDGDEDGQAASDDDEVTVEVRDLVTGLEVPWDVAWLGERAFVTERDRGRVLEVDEDGGTREVRRFPVDAAGEGGLLGLVADPDGRRLYAYLTTGADNRVVRFDPDADATPEVVVDGIPAARVHDGGRLAFGPDGALYVGTGDAGDPPSAQDPTSLAGKILRVTPDGDVPGDNPDPGSPVWSLGHRNVQGLAFDAAGRLFATEFGPDRDDEVNRIEPGADHGWPEVTGVAGRDGFADPVLVRQPAEASWSGGVVAHGRAVPRWEGQLFLASLRGERLYRVPLDDGEVVGDPVELYDGEFGRLRTVAQAPDGSLWLLTSNRDGRGDPRDGDDRIVRIGPP